MNVEQVGQILRGLGIDTRNLCEDTRLSEDLGMDSREVIELCSAIEEVAGIDIPERAVSRNATVREVLTYVSPCAPDRMIDRAKEEIRRTIADGEPAARRDANAQALAPVEMTAFRQYVSTSLAIDVPELPETTTMDDAVAVVRQIALFEGMDKAYAFGCEMRAEVACTVEKAYWALHRIAAWPSVLSHVEAVDVLYDDGRFQEFTMNVRNEGTLMRVRSVRRCEPTVGIRFFQPQPPACLKHHAGGWRFRALDLNRCEITAFHRWNIHEDASPPAFAARELAARKLLTDHARIAVETWKRHLEPGVGE